MLEQTLRILGDNEPVISAFAGLITLLAAIWGLVQLTVLPRRRQTVLPESGQVDRGRLRLLMNLGLTEHSELEELVSVRTVNVALLCVILLSLTWLVFALVTGDRLLLAITNLVVFIFCLVAYTCQERGATHVARWLALFAMGVYWLATTMLLGRFSGVEYFFAALMAMPILMFGRTQMPHMCLAIALVMCLFPVAVYLQGFPELAVAMPGREASIAYYVNVFFLAFVVFAPVHFYNNFAASSYRELEINKQRTDNLVNSMLPEHVAARMTDQQTAVADWHQEASVLFATVKGFEQLHKRMSATELVELLGQLYGECDRLVREYDVEKVNTLGTNYVAATGIDPDKPANHHALAGFALAMKEAVARFAARAGYPFSLQVGISTGQAITGVIGRARPCFDIWGDTVERANAMRDAAIDNTIVVNESAYWRLQDRYHFSGEPDNGSCVLLGEGRGAG